MQLIILGLGREGYSSYNFWRNQDNQLPIILVDDQPLEKLGANWKTSLIHDQYAGFVQANDFTQELSLDTLVMVSPGIKPSHPLLVKIEQSGAVISSNTQIFFEICLPVRAKNHPFSHLLPQLATQPKIIGITGTKGKSTTTSLIYHVLENAGLPAFLGGNIGKPPLDLIELIINSPKLNQPFIVLELSCHQLQTLTISPNIAVIQAITPEHLDYYQNFYNYQQSKAQICNHQIQGDWAIYNADNQISTKIATQSQAEQFCFSLNDQSCISFVKANKIYYQNFAIINTEELQLIGQHNWLNVLPSVIIANKLGVSPLMINKLLKSFSPLPHRLETVTQQNNITYCNDSLSTTPEATVAALKSFSSQPIILIAGGFDRGLDYSKLAKEIILQSVKLAILLPDTGSKIAKHLQQLQPHQIQVQQVPNLKTAVSLAKKQAENGDVILLSPGSASFNQFKDYQERGNAFKKLVL